MYILKGPRRITTNGVYAIDSRQTKCLNAFAFIIIEVGDQGGEGSPVPISNTEENLSSDLLSTEREFGKSMTSLTIIVVFIISLGGYAFAQNCLFAEFSTFT